MITGNLKALNDIIELSKDARSPYHVLQAVHIYFSKIVWSIEKDEWEKMTPKQRVQFATTVFNNNTRA